MANAPEHVIAAPPQAYQPYDATTEGTVDSAPQGGNPYAGNAGASEAGGWVKVKEAGAASMTDGTITGGWPGNGDAGDGGWKQC
jgi:hypothetical protein